MEAHLNGLTAAEIDELQSKLDELKDVVKELLDGLEHPDNVGEMWIPDFCGDAIEKLKKITDWQPAG